MALIPYIWLLSILHERDQEILVLITQIKAVKVQPSLCTSAVLPEHSLLANTLKGGLHANL